MSSKNREKRRKRRRRKRLKPSVKMGFAVFSVIVLIGLYAGYAIYSRSSEAEMLGKVGETEDFQDDATFVVTKGAIKYTVFSVGQGEAVLIESGDKEALIDAGPVSASEKLVKKLAGRIKGNLDYLILTGSDEGRIGGVPAVVRDFNVDRCIHADFSDGSDKESDLETRLRGWFGAERCERIKGSNLSYDMGDGATLSIIMPEVSSSDPRDQSLITYFTFGRTGFVTFSDAGKEEMARANASISRTNVVLLPRYGNIDAAQIMPDISRSYTVASSAKEGGALSPEMRDLMRGSYLVTGVTGDIEFVSDGDGVDIGNEDKVDEALEKYREELKAAEKAAQEEARRAEEETAKEKKGD